MLQLSQASTCCFPSASESVRAAWKQRGYPFSRNWKWNGHTLATFAIQLSLFLLHNFSRSQQELKRIRKRSSKKFYLIFSEEWFPEGKQNIQAGHLKEATVSSLNPWTVYQLRLFAENQLGKSKEGKVLQVSFDSQLFLNALLDLIWFLMTLNFAVFPILYFLVASAAWTSRLCLWLGQWDCADTVQ